MAEKDGNIDAHSVPIKSIHSNVAQVVIHTTEDKLKNIWLIVSGHKAWRAWKKSTSVEDIVERIKNDP